MPPAVNWLVPQIQLTGNNVVLTINVGGFSFGNWAEISGYIIQDDVIVGNAIQQPGAIIPFSAIQAVPDPATGSSSVTVSIAAQGLDPDNEVRVITRVAEVQIWPTGLQRDPHAAQGVVRWRSRTGNADNVPQVYRTGSPSSAGPADPAVIVELSGQSISLKDLQPGVQYRITIEAADS
jgi:hypothetical protein